MAIDRAVVTLSISELQKICQKRFQARRQWMRLVMSGKDVEFPP